MNKEELNTALKMELINYQTTNELTDDLKRLFLETIMGVSKEERYKYLNDNLKIYCEAKAYEDLCRHAIHFNPDRGDNAYAYVNQIIRSSFACMIVRHGNYPKTVYSFKNTQP